MAGTTLGKLEQVDVRDHWPDEAKYFTPWLASEGGLALLSEVIGIELELVGQEQPVGPFKADILARDATTDDHMVIIENQLDKTNHDHLGKIITYAAGLQATTVVWVAETFTDEHRQALDWLNENSGENLAFFGLQIELWKIGDSLPAAQFKVVSSPNEWTKAVAAGPTQSVSDTKQDQLRFWEELREYSHSRKSPLKFRKPRPQHWYSLSIDRSGFWMSLTINSFRKRVGCEIYMRGPQPKLAFDLLHAQQEQIEAEIGHPLEWQRLEKKKGSRIAIYKTDLLIDDPKQREEARIWLHQMAELFHNTFSNRIKALELPDEGEETSEEL